MDFNPGLVLTGFRTILPCFQQVNLTWAHDPIENPALGQRSTSKKHATSMNPLYGHVIWSADTLDRCQLIIRGMSNIKDQDWMSLSTYYLEYGRHVARLHRRRRRAYAPTSNTAVSLRVSRTLYRCLW